MNNTINPIVNLKGNLEVTGYFEFSLQSEHPSVIPVYSALTVS
jgi:hypothetical protein